MRILLVEDKRDNAQTLEKHVRAIPGCDLIWKKSKAGALTTLRDEPFDVVILDRRIPSDDDVLDDHVNHGWDVFQVIKETLPGTSVWFLTGSVDADFSADVLNDHSKNGDIHCGGRNDPVYRVFWKSRLNDCIAAVRAFRDQIGLLEAIHIEQVGEPVNLRHEEVRLLRLFARKHRGVSAEIKPLTGGLSGARVMRVTIKNAAGQPLITSVAKVGGFTEVAKEGERFQSEIIKLAPGSFPAVTAEISIGASGYAGIFYQIVGHNVASLFNWLADNPAAAASVPAALRNNQVGWLAAKAVSAIRVGAIRRKLIGDVALAECEIELGDIDIRAVERLEVEAAHCVQHGDLHCANVLFDERQQPMLIDYPDTGENYASLDPVVLELSTIFHKDAKRYDDWPSISQAELWTDLDAFVETSPIEAYLRACREWAIEVAASPQEVWAVAYAYTVRQLKYDDTNKALARAIIRSCIDALTGLRSVVGG